MINKSFAFSVFLYSLSSFANIVWDKTPTTIGGSDCSIYATASVIDLDGIGVENAFLWAEDSKGNRLITKCGLRESLAGSVWIGSEQDKNKPCRLNVQLSGLYKVGVTARYIDGGSPYLWETSEVKSAELKDCK